MGRIGVEKSLDFLKKYETKFFVELLKLVDSFLESVIYITSALNVEML